MTRDATLTIRAADATDWAAMLDLWVGAWTAARPEIDFGARRGWFDRHLNALAEQGAKIVIAADPNGAVLGFVTVDPMIQALDQLVTDVGAQGRGIGRALVHHAKRQSPAGLGLTVNQFNTRAIRLYEREGFAIIDEGVNPLSGLPVWHMRWPGPAAPADRPGRSEGWHDPDVLNVV